MQIPPELFGYAGTVTGTSFMIPQLWKTWRTKSVQDISWMMLVLFSFNGVFWFTYGVLLASPPLMLANAIAFVVSVLQIGLKFHYRKSA